jgi:hypothetical protein
VGVVGKSVVQRLDFVYTTLNLFVKSIKPPSKLSKPTILTYQAKQASLRYGKLQASKQRLLSLACLLISKSGYERRQRAFILYRKANSDRSTDAAWIQVYGGSALPEVLATASGHQSNR